MFSKAQDGGPYLVRTRIARHHGLLPVGYLGFKHPTRLGLIEKPADGQQESKVWDLLLCCGSLGSAANVGHNHFMLGAELTVSILNKDLWNLFQVSKEEAM